MLGPGLFKKKSRQGHVPFRRKLIFLPARFRWYDQGSYTNFGLLFLLLAHQPRVPGTKLKHPSADLPSDSVSVVTCLWCEEFLG